jgi:mannose-6-phosphate isomerase-like protein (cupin superfamily)
MPDYTVKKLSEMEASSGGGFVKVRASMGLTAFGCQMIQLPPDYDGYPEHDHAESGQEELYAIQGGSGWMDIEGERVELDPETFVRVAAEPRRKVFAGPEGLRMLVIGGCPGEPYKIWSRSELSTA